MASVENTGSKKGRKNINFELNLVPFIDLLSMCICFLLMTAVWLQLSTIKVHQSLGTSSLGATAPTKSYDVDVEFLSAKSMSIEVKNEKRVVKKEVVTSENIDDLLDKAKTRLGVYQTEKGIGTLLVAPHVEVNYSQLITFFDSMKGLGVQNFGVIPVRSR